MRTAHARVVGRRPLVVAAAPVSAQPPRSLALLCRGRSACSSSTAAVADVVPQNGLSLVAGSRRQFGTARARWRPEPRLHGSASVCTVPDGHFGGCVRAAGPQQQRYRRSGSQRTQIRLESALYRRSTSILARSSRNGPLGAVSLATLGDKTAVRPVNDPIIPRVSAAHPRGEWPRGALDRAAHRHRVRNRWSDSKKIIRVVPSPSRKYRQ